MIIVHLWKEKNPIGKTFISFILLLGKNIVSSADFSFFGITISKFTTHMYKFSRKSPKKSRLEEDKSDLFHVYDRFAILQMLTLHNHVYHGIPVFKVSSIWHLCIYSKFM